MEIAWRFPGEVAGPHGASAPSGRRPSRPRLRPKLDPDLDRTPSAPPLARQPAQLLRHPLPPLALRPRRAAPAPLRLQRELERKLAVALDARSVDAPVGDRLPNGALGLPPWEQSRKWHRAAIAARSSNAASSPLASHSRSSRIPGPSTSAPPPGSAKSSRPDVVWTPRSSEARTGVVRCASRPRSAFVRVDFPAPEGPTRTPVLSGRRRAASAAMPSPVSPDATSTSTAGAAARASASATARFSARSGFVRTIAGSAPPA